MITDKWQEGAFVSAGGSPTVSRVPHMDDHTVDNVARRAAAEFNASRYNSVYGSSPYVRPNSRKVVMLIKF